MVLCSFIYHCMLDSTCIQHSLCLILYAPADSDPATNSFRFNSFIVWHIQWHLQLSNHDVERFQYLPDLPPCILYELELQCEPTASNEIAAIFHRDTITCYAQWSVDGWCGSLDANEGTFFDILSTHYGPLQHLLLFVHATPQWRHIMRPKLSQMQHYRLLWLKSDIHFYSLGMLAYE